MKISDVTRFFAENIGRNTNYFNDNVGSISSVSILGSNISVTTSQPHTLKTGDRISVTNMIINNPITGVVANGQNIRFTTQFNNDLTVGYHSEVTLAGFTDTAWNGTATLIDVPKRTQFVTDNQSVGLPVLNGNEILKEVIEVGQFGPNLVTVTVNNITSFTFNAGIDLTGRTVAINNIARKVRVSAVVNIDRARDSYTQHGENKFWAFLSPNNVSISKDRRTVSDAVSERGSTTSMIETVMDSFNLYVFAPTSEQYAAVGALDICRHDLLLPILRTLRGVRFDAGTSVPTKNGAILTEHGLVDYTGAFLIYSYTFQVVSQLSDQDQNNFISGGTVAFRDVDMTFTYETGTTQGVNTIKLDKELI